MLAARGGTTAIDQDASVNCRPSPQPGAKDPAETSSVTEDDNSEDDSDSRESAAYRCTHCFTTSITSFSH